MTNFILNEIIIRTSNLKSVPALVITAGNVTNIYEGDAGMSILSKKCTKCGEVKSVSDFSKHSNGKYGVDSRCKLCAAADARKNHHKNRDANVERHRAWRQANIESEREKARVRARQWRKDNPEKSHENSRNWYLSNLERVFELARAWKRSNPQKVRALTNNRRARIRGSVGKITAAEIESLKAKQDYICLCCKRREPEIKLTHDHVKPIAMGGENTIANSQMLCGSCNSRKGARWIDYR